MLACRKAMRHAVAEGSSAALLRMSPPPSSFGVDLARFARTSLFFASRADRVFAPDGLPTVRQTAH